jgi:hypothetical protein
MSFADRAPMCPALVVLAALVAFQVPAPEPTLPLEEGSLRFAVIGDSGTGDRAQYEIGALMADARTTFPFELVLMLGDNLYGSETPRDYQRKFERPYEKLLSAGVKFYASLGNHDTPSQRFYRFFNMGGQRYYSFAAPRESVRFFALDSNYMDPAQIKWLEGALGESTERWKICFFHHPIYSSGARHGSDVELRLVLEPLFLKYGVTVVFAGHEHFYERLKPQHGIHYFTSGAAAKLRRGNIRPGPLTAVGFDQDRSFMLAEIAGDAMRFQAISRAGRTVDSGTVVHPRRHTSGAARAVTGGWWTWARAVGRAGVAIRAQ